jgi:hypothetical protein
MNNLVSLIEDQKHIFWWIPENELTQLSVDAIVEAVLNNGDEKAVRYLFDILGVEKVAKLFYHQVSGKRTNYRPRTIHCFRTYFKRHVPRYSDNKTN